MTEVVTHAEIIKKIKEKFPHSFTNDFNDIEQFIQISRTDEGMDGAYVFMFRQIIAKETREQEIPYFTALYLVRCSESSVLTIEEWINSETQKSVFDIVRVCWDRRTKRSVDIVIRPYSIFTITGQYIPIVLHSGGEEA